MGKADTIKRKSNPGLKVVNHDIFRSRIKMQKGKMKNGKIFEIKNKKQMNAHRRKNRKN